MQKIKKSEPLDDVFNAFTNSLKAHSKGSYRTYFAHWVNFTGLNGAATLQFKRDDKDAETEKKVVAFKQYLLDIGLSENTAKTATGAIRGFYSAHRMKLEFIGSERKRIAEANRSTIDYLFSREDLAKMANVDQANLQERYILLVGKSVGLRAGDFLSLTYGTFRGSHIDGEAPIALGEVVTAKEHVRAYPFLDSDAAPIVKAMLERSPQAGNDERILQLDEQSLTLTVQRLFERAHLESGSKHVRFHSLRKYLFDRLTAIASTEQAKQIIGKKISEGAYISQEQLRDIYTRAMPSIVVNGNMKNHAKLDELESKFADMGRLIGDLTMTIDALKLKDRERTEQIDNLKAQVDTLAPEETRRRVKALRQKRKT